MVIVKYGEIEASMDGYLNANLELYKKMVVKSRDLVFIVAGKEREGKSTLANGILKYLDPTYNLDRCCFSAEEFLEQLKKAKNFQAVCFDEAQPFTSRSALSRLNKTLIHALSIIGMKQLYIAIVLPSYFELDKYPAIHRSNFLLRVYTSGMTRGFFEFWNWEKKKDLYLFGKKNYNYFAVKPNFRGRFFANSFPFIQEEYDKKKWKAIEVEQTLFRDRTVKAREQRDILIRYLYRVVGLKELAIADLLKDASEPLTRQGVSVVINAFKKKSESEQSNGATSY